ncbi:unnamed protein product, partial [Musa acuminata var. zebrina]
SPISRSLLRLRQSIMLSAPRYTQSLVVSSNLILSLDSISSWTRFLDFLASLVG